jgi:hypothetical protein
VTDAEDFGNWFRTALDMVEGTARAVSAPADPVGWQFAEPGSHARMALISDDGSIALDIASADLYPASAVAHHIGIWSPQFVVTVVESVHAVLATHRNDGGTCHRCVRPHNDGWPPARVAYPCPTVRRLAQPFATVLPGYRKAWNVAQ